MYTRLPATQRSNKAGLRRSLCGLCLLAGLSLLAACGPKDIGEGMSEEETADTPLVSTAEDMRYPMTGASLSQQRLYHLNRPMVMEYMQNWQRERLFPRAQGTQTHNPQMMGISPEDPAYRAVPKQRSPFRQ